MGSTFISAFENIHPEYRAMKSTFSSAFNTKHTLTVELLVQHSTCILNIELCDRYSALHSKSYTILNIELMVRHSALHSELFILNIELWVDVQLCIQHHTHFEYRAIGSTYSSAFEKLHHDIQRVVCVECRAEC